MFNQNPIYQLLSLTTALCLFPLLSKKPSLSTKLFYLLLFLLLTILNPLTYHNGQTILFVLNNHPITGEATLWGFSSSCLILSVLLRFRLFSDIMTSDRLLYVLSFLSAKAALVLSMALRYIPLLRTQWKKIADAEKGMGLCREDSLVEKIRGSLHRFSVLAGWSLENGIITADSMEARGYGVGKRSRFALFQFSFSDILFLILTLLFFFLTLIALISGAFSFQYYPALSFPKRGFLFYAGLISYFMLAFLPIFTQGVQQLQWKYYEQKR
jgi:energy-coupling factor transport system permease protein